MQFKKNLWISLILGMLFQLPMISLSHAASSLVSSRAAACQEWAEGNSYTVGEVVTYEGSTYTCIQANTAWVGAGWNPVATLNVLWTAGGSCTGPTPVPSTLPVPVPTPTPTNPSSPVGNCSPAWDPTMVYTGGAQVSYEGVNYTANWWTLNQNPSTNSGPAGSGQPWTSNGSCSGTSPSPTPSTVPSSTPSSAPSTVPTPTPTSSPGPQPSSAPLGFVFSPYKDTSINMNWNTNVISTEVTGQAESLLSAMPSALNTVTWAFATGACGSENWAGVQGAALASANVSAWVNAGKNYIISTGGAAGSFTCTDDADFATFINRYYSANLVGIDFDIEAGQSQTDVDNLVQRVQVAQQTYPNLRFSFTVATLGGNVTPSLGVYGTYVMNSIQKYGLKNYLINLMAMDYGSAGGGNCIVGSNGLCEMGQSAVQSAIDLHNQYGVPYSQIEVTPMIGGNDSAGETFTIGDVTTLSTFALQNGLAGIHFWSFDRDVDCAPGSASPTCNTYGQAGTLGFTHTFLSQLGL